jgi:hypothetical protein
MTIQSSIRGLALCVAAAFGLSISTPSQAQVEVDVDITFNGLTILYYYSELDVTVPASAFAGLVAANCAGITNGIGCDQGASAALTATGDASGLTANAALVAAAPSISLTAVPLDLDNVWAVRAVGGASGNTSLTFAVAGGATLVNGAGEIEVNSAQGYAGTSGTPAATVTFADPGLVTPQNGGVRLLLDLTDATTNGTYSGAADDTYTITISAT